MKGVPPSNLPFSLWFNLDTRPGVTPEELRDAFNLAVRMLDDIKAVRAAYAAERAPLADRIAAAGIQQEIEKVVWRINRRLVAIARRGGRGVLPSEPSGARGAGAEPLRYAAKDGGAFPAVGPALTGLQNGARTPSEEPAFSVASRQTLPVAQMHANVDHD